MESELEMFEPEKWVITKNEKGTVKVATCEENETRMYEKTRDWIITEDNSDDNDVQVTGNQKPKNIARFFIRDLLNAEQVGDCFSCKGIRFCTVFICGNVVDKYKNGDYYHIEVDDGTSSIRCIMSVDYWSLIEKSDTTLDGFKDWLSNKENNDVLLKGAQIMMSSIRYLTKSWPSFDELELGDTVKIIGVLKKYAQGRNIFVKKIMKEQNSSIMFTTYLEEMINMYKEDYSLEVGNLDS